MHQKNKIPSTELSTKKRSPETIELLLTIAPSDESLGFLYIGGASEKPTERLCFTFYAGVEYL
jgi:hypothetical protein